MAEQPNQSNRARRGRGEGNIEILPSGKFRAVLSVGIDPETNKRKKISFTAVTKREAAAWLRDRLQEQNRGTLAHAGQMTVGEWLNRWLEAKHTTVERGTHVFYERMIRLHLRNTIGTLLLNKLTPLHIQSMFAKLTERGTSADQQHKAATTLRACLADAVKHRLIATNPACEVKKPLVRRLEKRALTLDEARRFLTVARTHRLGAMYELAIDTGMRPGEMLGLHWPEVDLGNGTIYVRQSLEELDGQFSLKPPKTTKSRRTIAIAPRTIRALHEHRERMREEGMDTATGPVFVNLHGKWLSQPTIYRRVFHPLLKKAELPKIRPYDLRHTCATLLLMQGVSIKVVSERLGHENIEMTLKHYVHVLPGMQAQAVSAVTDMFGSDSPTMVPQKVLTEDERVGVETT